ncbi:MAG: DUF2070 family protein [Metallosphaera sp.]
MDSEKLTRSYYSKLIRLPSVQALSIWVGAEVGLSLVRSLFDGIGYIAGLLVYILLNFFALHKRVKTFLAMMGIFGIIYLITSFLPLIVSLSFGLFIPLMTYIMLIDYGDLTSPALSTGIGMISGLLTLPTNVGLFVAFYLAVGVFSYLYIILVNRKGKDVTGIPSLKIVRPFLRAMSYKREEEVESFLERISTRINSSIVALKLGEVTIILPRIHFGMYGRVGSSLFPYQVEEELNAKAIVFHGPGSHELDLASSRESLKVAREVSEKIRSGKWNKLSFLGIAFSSQDRFRITSLVFDRFSLNFAERPGYGIDDLPGDLWDTSLKTNNFVVDCHNESLKEEISSRDETDLKEFLKKRWLMPEKRVLRVGYGETQLDRKCEGVCNDKVKALVLDDGEKRVLIIYVFANNADEETGKLIQEKFKSRFDRVILITPDDHSCTGTSFGNLYTPAEPCPALLEPSEKAAQMAESRLREVEAGYMIIDVKTKAIGKFISIMIEGLEQVGNFAMRTFWIPVAFPYVMLAISLLGDYLIKF